MRRKINVQLISISIIAIISTMLVMLFVFYDLFQTQVQDDLSANAIVLKNTGIFHSGNEKAIHMDYRELRVTWISSDGTVLYDADVGTMDNHMSRPEVKNAFKRGDGSAVRQSATMGTNTFYYAIKLNDGSVLRVAREASNIWTVGGKIFPIIAATILVMMILCIILAHFMTKNLVKPIEQMAALRAMPNFHVFRPCDATETEAAWYSAVTSEHTPTALVLTRQNLEPMAGSSREALKGGYIIDDCEGTPELILIASGSEVALAVHAKETLAAEGQKVRVVSMPCMDLFEGKNPRERIVIFEVE